jgi:hypothetical protein
MQLVNGRRTISPSPYARSPSISLDSALLSRLYMFCLVALRLA